MARVLEVLRSLGNAGAVANAADLANARRREDWVVRSLARKVPGAATPAAPARRSA